MIAAPADLADVATRLRASRFDRARMHAALVGVADRLGAPTETQLREDVRHASALSAEMVAFALETSACVVTAEALASLDVATHGRARVGLAGIVLAGNVTSAAIRAITVPLALGVPVIVKASSRDAVVARAFARMLIDIDAEQGARLEVVAYEGGDDDYDAALLAACDVVHVYGSDETIAAFRTRAAKTRLVAHGHGFGVAVVSADADVEEAALAIALDVVAYDQRGCLSPHAVYVIGDALRRRALAGALSSAIEASPLLAGELDAGALATRHAARALAAMEGEVLEGATSIVACADVLRASPLGRFVRVLRVPDTDALVRALADVSRDLTCIGVAGGALAPVARARAHFFPRARITRAGAMQRPELTAPVDGLPCFEGFVCATEERT